ncbi:MAG TPA: cohesin domain-containing protein [Anaerolineae bacterium]
MATLIAIGVAANILPTRAQTATVVRLTPANQQLTMGQAALMTVEVVNVQGLYGLDVILSYDPAMLEVVGSNPNQQPVQVTPGTFLEAGFAVANTVDNAHGIVRFAMTQLNPAEPKSGNGALFSLNIRPKRADVVTSLNISKADLSGRDGVLIPATFTSAQMVVAAQGTTAATPLPTQPSAATSQVVILPTATPAANPMTVGQPTAVVIVLTPVQIAATPTPLSQGASTPVPPPTAATAAPIAATPVSAGAAPIKATTPPLAQPTRVLTQAPADAAAVPPMPMAKINATSTTAAAAAMAQSAVGTVQPTSPAVAMLNPNEAPGQAVQQPNAVGPSSVDMRGQLSRATVETLLVAGLCGIAFFLVAAFVALTLMLLNLSSTRAAK